MFVVLSSIMSSIKTFPSKGLKILSLVIGEESSKGKTSNCVSDDKSILSYSGTDSYHPSSNESENSDSEGTECPKMLDKKKRKRKKANKNEWKRTVVKKLRLEGKSYINRSGKVTPAKAPKAVDCTKCRFNCSNKFNEDQRQLLCKEYWALADDRQQKIYLSSLFKNIPVTRVKVTAKKHKSISRIYELKNNCGESKRVCLKFFYSTFDISHRVTERLMSNVSDSGLYTGYDKRVNSKPVNATPSEDFEHVKTHINMFPRVESHYCRKDSRKLYLSQDLNLSKLYDLYKSYYCKEKNIQPVSQFVYRKIFNSYDPPLSFYIPKKDQCTQCNIYRNSVDQSTLHEQWQAHKRREEESMAMKKDDKEKCLLDNGITYRSITFDLQALLSVPYASDTQLYYKRKLNVYNFTIFDCHNNDGYCYVWDECNGRKGSSEIGTCILEYLKQLPPTVSHVSSFSDTCGGQNRNKNIVAAMLFAINKFNNLKTIDLKYMEPGHSYLEADSMHATVERAKKYKKLYTTREWALLISAARKRQYKVKTMINSDFYDLEKLSNEMLLNTNFNTEKERVNWLKIKWLRFEKSEPFIVKYKYGLSEPFMKINIHQKRKAGRTKNWESVDLFSKYPNQLPVTKEKKADLDWMIEQKIIPNDYKPFYDRISCVSRPKNDSDYEDDDDEH